MRIISGSLKGRSFYTTSPKEAAKGLRPTSEKVREAIFSSLQSIVDFSQSNVLDLFAGSGSLGIEALSRGAKSSVFVESDRKTARVLKENLELLDLQYISEVLCVDISRMPPQKLSFELVFADPPYKELALTSILELLCKLQLVAENSVLVLESSAHKKDSAEIEALPAEDRHGLLAEIVKQKKYGDTLVTYFVFKRRIHD